MSSDCQLCTNKFDIKFFESVDNETRKNAANWYYREKMMPTNLKRKKNQEQLMTSL